MKESFPDPRSIPVLPDSEIERCMGLLLDEDVGDDPKADFLDNLHRRGENAAELAGFARNLLGKAIHPSVDRGGDAPILELCGTGGDRKGYLNISTAAMFVAAGAGARVVKHGNRALSSKCGSADVLEALGVPLGVDPRRAGDVLSEAGCVFLLAVDHHPALAALSPLRKKMAAEGKLTIFNLLGPLLNPCHPEVQLAGIYRAEMLSVYAEALRLLGRRRAWAVHGAVANSSEGVDEISILAPTSVCETDSQRKEMLLFELRPEHAGFKTESDESALVGGDARTNAGRIQEILRGSEEGPATAMILLNAGAALHLSGIGKNLTESAAIAEESLRSGKALRALEKLKLATAELVR